MAARQREPLWVLYVWSPDILCFFSAFYLYTESVYFILLCNMSNKILLYYTKIIKTLNISELIMYGCVIPVITKDT